MQNPRLGHNFVAGAETRQEMQRLAGERAALMATGIYSPEDALIHQIDARIGRLCAEQLQS